MPTQEDFWQRYDAIEARLTAPVSERMLDLAGLKSGMRVLDLATGRGEPALRAARRVAPDGMVVGLEISEPMLRMASELAARDGLRNLDLRVGNAESRVGLAAQSFHAVITRWGLMYMVDPIAALRNARHALLPNGVLVAALWAEPERVPYFTLPRLLLSRYRPVPRIDPTLPGTFRFADPKRITDDFKAAGFVVEHVEEEDVAVVEASNAAELIDWARALGLAQLLDELPQDQQQAWEHDLTRELEKTRVAGMLRLGGVTRIVRARPRA